MYGVLRIFLRRGEGPVWGLCAGVVGRFRAALGRGRARPAGRPPPGDRFEHVMSAGALSRAAANGSAVALSRVTLVGERRRVDLVLPAREPVGVLLPEILRVLGDRVGERPESRHLVTVDGSALGHDSSLESAGVRDGAVLRLVRAGDAPSAPVVSDEVVEDPGGRAWRWGHARVSVFRRLVPRRELPFVRTPSRSRARWDT